MDQDQSAALELHQKARAELSINPLTWDTNLSNDAQNYANQLASLDGGLEHDNQKAQGENLAQCSGAWNNPFTEACKLWYAEKKDWTGDVTQIQENEAVGHYTQMIWSRTTHIGMAFAISPSEATYVVARYLPPGNILGESPQQGTTKGRGHNTPANAFSPCGRPALSRPSSNPQHKHSPYGQQRHRRPQPSYNGRRAYIEMIGTHNNDDEGPFPRHRYSGPRLTMPDALGRRHVNQVHTETRARTPVSHDTYPHRTPYGTSRGPGPYGGGAHGMYASAVPHGGHRPDGGSKTLCCAVM